MADHIYHWKHGWIPLDHYAALSKAKGSHAGAARYLDASHAAGHAHQSVVGSTHAGGTHVRGLQPVSNAHLPRRSSVTAAFNPASRRFALHDKTGLHADGINQGEVTTSIPEHLAAHIHDKGYSIWRVRKNSDGPDRVVVTTGGGATKSFAADGTDIHQVDPTVPHFDQNAHSSKPVGGSPHMPTWTKISTEQALGPDTRTEKQKIWDQYVTTSKRGRQTTRNTGARERALAKVKEAYRHRDGHTVLIEPAMSKAKTAEFLASVDHVVSNASAKDLAEPVRFHVPSGDRSFSSGRTLAYVRTGEHAVYVSPKLAAGYEHVKTDHFMPAHDVVSTQRYSLAHELGHVIDHRHQHIPSRNSPRHSPDNAAALQQSMSTSLFQQYRGELSKYGRTNAAEAYAEAYAQWHSGQHNAIADAYAARYGWTR